MRSISDLSGYGVAGVEDGPVFLGPAVIAYLTLSRRPIPRVTSLTARTLSGHTLWRRPLAAGLDPSDLTALRGHLLLTVRHGAQAIVEERSPVDGRVWRTVSIPWHGHALAPLATPLPAGDVLLTGSPLDLSSNLGGLGPGAPAVWVLGRGLRVVWHRPQAGRLLAIGPGIVLLGRLGRANRRVVRLTAYSPASGRVLWTSVTAFPGVPVISLFSITASGNLLWAEAGPTGARLSLLLAATGRPLWVVPSRRTIWMAAGTLALGGSPPWQPRLGLEARALTTGRRLWTLAQPALPVAAIGDHALLAMTGPKKGGPPHAAHLAWVPLAPTSAGHRVGPTVTQTSVPGGAPPYTVACTPTGAQLLTPWIAGSIAAIARPG